MYFLNVCCGDRCLLSPVVILWPGLGSPPASKASAFLTSEGLLSSYSVSSFYTTKVIHICSWECGVSSSWP